MNEPEPVVIEDAPAKSTADTLAELPGLKLDPLQ